MHTTLSRRDFLRITGGTASAGFVYLLLKPKTASANIKPPGALSEPDFSALCLRCGKCTSACEQHALKIDNQGFPFIDGIPGWCDFSGECVDACPTGALLPFVPDTIKIAKAVIDQERCIAWNWNGCRLCYEKCTDLQTAIWLDDDILMRPHVDVSLCNGCGACVFVCPQSAREGVDRNKGKAVSLQPVE